MAQKIGYPEYLLDITELDKDYEGVSFKLKFIDCLLDL